MGKKPNSKENGDGYNGLKKFVAIFATFVIVVGVSVVAALSSRPSSDTQEKTSVVSPDPAVAISPEPAFMVLDKDGAKLVSVDGKRERGLVWPDDASSLGKALSLIKGADARSGQPAWLDPGFVHASPTAVRAPDGRRTAWIGSDRRDGSTTVFIKYGNETQTYTLRQTNGRKIADAQLIGWTAPQELAFVGLATSSRALFRLDTNGSIAYIAPIPDEAWLFRANDAAVYYTTAQTGQGIETAQSPPSALWRVATVMPGAKAEKIWEENRTVIQSFITGSDGRISYILDDGSVRILIDGQPYMKGPGTPILFAGNDVLTRDGEKLVLYSHESETPRATFDANPDATVFYLESARIDDETVANKQ